MNTLQSALLRSKGRWQTRTLMRKYRARVWWGVELWTEAELRLAWGDR